MQTESNKIAAVDLKKKYGKLQKRLKQRIFLISCGVQPEVILLGTGNFSIGILVGSYSYPKNIFKIKLPSWFFVVPFDKGWFISKAKIFMFFCGNF